jgi:biopolymer transport protein ExbB/TolQ
LIVAIPSYIAYNYLVSRVQNLVLDMEKAANETVQYLVRKEEGVEQSSKVVSLR